VFKVYIEPVSTRYIQLYNTARFLLGFPLDSLAVCKKYTFLLTMTISYADRNWAYQIKKFLGE